MNAIHTNVIIIGAGLTGLTLAYRLQLQGIDCKIIEARDRLGGRIHTHYSDKQAPIELGATWLGKQHKTLIKLLNELDSKVFEQKMGKTAIYEPISTSPHQVVSLPPSDMPSFRIVGGSQTLIDRLAQEMTEDRIILSHAVRKIEITDASVTAQTEAHTLTGNIIVSTLPPLLFANTIEISPTLPKDLTALMQQTHTWMGESIKVALSYNSRFWEEGNLSGTIFSNVGPIPEMYDHSNFEDNLYALKGFLNGSYYGVSKAERQALVINQLKKYYGAQVEDFISYEEQVWRNEPYTHVSSDAYILPHQNNGHALYQQGYLNNKLYIGGTETSTIHGGYMDGAVHSANTIYDQLMRLQKG